MSIAGNNRLSGHNNEVFYITGFGRTSNPSESLHLYHYNKYGYDFFIHTGTEILKFAKVNYDENRFKFHDNDTYITIDYSYYKENNSVTCKH